MGWDSVYGPSGTAPGQRLLHALWNGSMWEHCLGAAAFILNCHDENYDPGKQSSPQGQKTTGFRRLDMSQTRAVRCPPPPPPRDWCGIGGSAGGVVAMPHRGVWGHRHLDGAAEGGPSEVVAHWPLSSAFLGPFLFGFCGGEAHGAPGAPSLPLWALRGAAAAPLRASPPPPPCGAAVRCWRCARPTPRPQHFLGWPPAPCSLRLPFAGGTCVHRSTVQAFTLQHKPRAAAFGGKAPPRLSG